MHSNYGYFLLLFGSLLSVYGALASIGAAFLRHRRLYLSAKAAITVTSVLVTIASTLLWVAFFDRDFQNLYVANNSSLDLPQLYTLTAFWSSLEGSHLLWTLMMAILAAICVWTHARDNEHIMPYVSAILQLVILLQVREQP